MATTPWLASGLLACLAVPPALGQMTVFDVRDLLVDQEGRWPVQLQDWHGRRNVLTELADAGFRRKNKDWSVTSEDQGYVMVRGGKEATREFMAMMTDLRRGNVRAVELQISMIRLPAAMASANGLQDGKTKDVTPDQVALILRQVQEARGTLANLPEIRTKTLHAFEMPVPDGTASAKGDRTRGLVVRGQMLPLGDVGAVRLELCEQKPENGAKDAPVWSCVAAMEVGKGVVVTRIQGEQASLLWVRLTTATEPAKDPVSGVDPGGKK